jgi:hypothetical protein
MEPARPMSRTPARRASGRLGVNDRVAGFDTRHIVEDLLPRSINIRRIFVDETGAQRIMALQLERSTARLGRHSTARRTCLRLSLTQFQFGASHHPSRRVETSPLCVPATRVSSQSCACFCLLHFASANKCLPVNSPRVLSGDCNHTELGQGWHTNGTEQDRPGPKMNGS